MNETDVRKCIKNGHAWSSCGDNPEPTPTRDYTRGQLATYEGLHATKHEAKEAIDASKIAKPTETPSQEGVPEGWRSLPLNTVMERGDLATSSNPDMSLALTGLSLSNDAKGGWVEIQTLSGERADLNDVSALLRRITETPAEKDARIKALVDGYKAKGGPITKEQLTDEVVEYLNRKGRFYYSVDGTIGNDYTGNFDEWDGGPYYWNKADAKHAKWLADMQSQTTPITPEQAKDLLAKDTVCWPTRAGSIQQGEWGKAKQWFTDCPFWFTLEAYRTSLANQKSVESYETPVGETQGKEVVTDETQGSEPVKWKERGRDEVIQEGDEVHHSGCDWRLATYEIGRCAKGVIGDCSGPLATRYITSDWQAWKARQDAKESNKEPVAPVEVTPTNESESAKSSNKPTTVRGWLETIPDAVIRESALRQLFARVASNQASSLPMALSSAFDWRWADEGFDFWNTCRSASIGEKSWPAYPFKDRQEADGQTQVEIDKAVFKPVGNKYHRTIHGVTGGSLVVDVYNVLDAFGVTCPACQHAIKKLLCAGLRNKGSRLQDLTEAEVSVKRAVELEQQRKEGEK